MRHIGQMALASALILPALSLAPRSARHVNADVAPSANSPAEVQRIRAHFDSVLTELAARDLSGLTAQQRTNRSGLVATLEAYRDRGLFPHNYDFPGQAVPYFVDGKTGTLCAVAHLLEWTGRRDIVDRVARADNNVWVPALSGDGEFELWLDEQGVTLAEAARIQVPYVGEPVPAPGGPPAQRASSKTLEVAAPVVGVGAIVAGLWNAYGNTNGLRGGRTILGLTSGLVATGIGVATLSRSDASPTIGAASALAGTVGIAVATRALFNRHRTLAASRDAEKARADETTTVTPLVNVGNGGSAGVSVSIRF